MLLDVLGADPTFGVASREALRNCLGEGGLVACDMVWAEVGAWFPSDEAAEEALTRLGVAFSPLDASTALAAGSAWATFRRRGGKRTRVVPDFLIGAHATSKADRLLTRDRGFYRSYFDRVKLVDPAAQE